MDFSGSCLNSTPRKEHIVVSLTSYPARFPTLHLCIKSILAQTVKADRVVLYLDETVQDAEIPFDVQELTAYGLEIIKIPYDMRSHKKYFFAMQSFPDSVIITCDDDVMYRKTMIGHLLESYRKHPESVSALRVHLITKDSQGKTGPYASWKKEFKGMTQPSRALCAVGVGGILYPPHILPAGCFDKESIKSLCYKADDIWLKFMELKSDVPVVWKRTFHVYPVEIAEQRDTGLHLENVNKNQNDMYIENMEKYTKIRLADYC